MADAMPQEVERKTRSAATAVVPLDQVTAQGAGDLAAAVDRQLRSFSQGQLTLPELMTAAGPIPVLGNILGVGSTAVDVFNLLARDSLTADFAFDDWASLGANAIGTFAGASSEGRIVLRPTVQVLRQHLHRDGQAIDATTVALLTTHLNATLAGTLEAYVQRGLEMLGPMLEQAANLVQAITNDLAAVLERRAGGSPTRRKPRSVPLLHDPHQKYEAFWGAFHLNRSNAGPQARRSANDAATLHRCAALARELGSAAKSSLRHQADPGVPRSIAWLLSKLLEASKTPPVIRNVVISPTRIAEVNVAAPGHQLVALSAENTGAAVPGCKNSPAPSATGGSIDYATGAERLTHTDFMLPGRMPIVWHRTYCSSLGALDSAGPLGARWITPYTTRIEQAADGSLKYHAADGRTHAFPRLAAPSPGVANVQEAMHYNPIERLNLGRADDGLLLLGLGRDVVETYELAPQFIVAGQPRTRNRPVHYRLASVGTRAGHKTEFRYRTDGSLADIVSGDAHVHTEMDANGRIRALWQLRDGKPVRQLAAYTYAEQPDGSSDLVAAEDENQQAWAYEYQHEGRTADAPGNSTHLLTRYTDRTGRAMHLRWMHEAGLATPIAPADSARAKAYREWADDGSLDVTLIWNRHIRLVTAIDALGGETRRYFDDLGYTYRIVHPEVRATDGQRYAHQEWFFRDEQKERPHPPAPRRHGRPVRLRRGQQPGQAQPPRWQRRPLRLRRPGERDRHPRRRGAGLEACLRRCAPRRRNRPARPRHGVFL